MEKEQRCGNIRTIRVTHRNHICAIKTILPCGCLNEVQKFFRAKFEIFQVKYSMRETSKEPWHTVLENVATAMVELNRAYPDGLLRAAGRGDGDQAVARKQPR